MEGKSDDEAIREIEEQEEPKPQVVPSVPHTASKRSVIKSAQPSRDASRSRTATPEGRPDETLSMARIPSEKISAPPDYLISESVPSSTHMTEVPGSKTPSAGQLSDSNKRIASAASKSRTETSRGSAHDKIKVEPELLEDFPSDTAPKKRISAPAGLVGCLAGGLPSFENFSCSKFIGKRSPFVHNPPRPEERRLRIERPRTPRDYIINLREDLADFQESHGLPRSRDYSFMSLGLALAQETARAICSVFLMFSELFPVIAIISLVLRFALDKLIDILETQEPVPKLKKTLIFCLQMVMILIPLWILIGTIVLPLAGLLFSIFRKLLRFKGGKSGGRSCSYPKKQGTTSAPKKIDPPKTKASCGGSSG